MKILGVRVHYINFEYNFIMSLDETVPADWTPTRSVSIDDMVQLYNISNLKIFLGKILQIKKSVIRNCNRVGF